MICMCYWYDSCVIKLRTELASEQQVRKEGVTKVEHDESLYYARQEVCKQESKREQYD